MSINDVAMADLARLPDSDILMVSKLDDPIGSGQAWKFTAMRNMLHRAERAEKQRDELLAALEAITVQFEIILPSSGLSHDERMALIKSKAAIAHANLADA